MPTLGEIIIAQLAPQRVLLSPEERARQAAEAQRIPMDRRPASIRATTYTERVQDTLRDILSALAAQPVGQVTDALGLTGFDAIANQPAPKMSIGMMPDRPGAKLGEVIKGLAAKRNASPVSSLTGYRGTPHGAVTPSDATRFYSSNKTVADGYTYPRGVWRSSVNKGTVEQSEIVMSKPLIIDALGKRNDNIPVPWQEWTPKVYGNLPRNAVSVEKAAEYAKANGYDGLIVRNVVDTADPTDKNVSDVYAVFAKP